jgi:hypothetical protein
MLFSLNSRYLYLEKLSKKNKDKSMAINKNTVLAWATTIMIIVGLGLIALGAFRYNDVAGWGFAAVGGGFFCIAWVFNALKGRV